MSKRKTHKEYCNEVFELVGDKFSVMSEYICAREKITIKHNECGYVWEVGASSFLKTHGCPQCSGTLKKTNDQFLNELKEKHGDEFTPLEEYKGTFTKIMIKHNKCGKTWEVAPHTILGKNKCPHCAGLKKKTAEEFKEEVYNIYGNEYEVVKDYVNQKTKVTIKHNECGYEFDVFPSNLTRKLSGCPKCKVKSIMEKDVIKVIDELKLKCKHSVWMNELKDKRKLEFDHVIYDKKGNPILVIECNGKQHYEHCPYFHKNGQSIEKQIKHDNMKAMYCVEHNIKLLVIPYWEKCNIEQIIKNHPIIKNLIAN